MAALHLPLEQVTNLGEQLLFLRRLRRGLGFFLLHVHDPAQELHDEEKQGRCHDQKVEDVSQEQTVRNLLAVDG